MLIYEGKGAHNRKLIAAMVREQNQRDSIIEKFEERMVSLEDQLNHLSLKMKEIRAEEEEDKIRESVIT
jgi:hypothetical protein